MQRLDPVPFRRHFICHCASFYSCHHFSLFAMLFIVPPHPRSTQATLPTTKGATPSSSERHLICTVTPVFAEYAIRIMAATFPPVTVLPYNLSVCVLLFIGTSVPSSGCSDSVFASCSTASRVLLACTATSELFAATTCLLCSSCCPTAKSLKLPRH
jgi:hypothetical protein